MSNSSKALVLLASALVALALVSGSLAFSIQSADPVKVTHRNSGPKYDIDDVEKTKLNPTATDSSNRQQANEEPRATNVNNNNNNNNEPQTDGPIPIGHMSIRRIFLVPMSHESSSGDQEQLPNGPFMPRPFWPFSLAPAARHPGSQPHHLFGSDQASRSPTSGADDNDSTTGEDRRGAEREGERESAPSGQVQPPNRPIFDPIQMMVDLMHQAINGQLAPPADLNNEASSDNSNNNNNNNNNNRPTNEIDRPIKPQSQNETKEDIVEIEGKKYLRKTVINRHVGENIIFMTKRLIFVPLNETDGSATTEEATTTTTTTTTTVKPADKDDDSSEMPIRPTQSAPTTTASDLASSPVATRADPVGASSSSPAQTTTSDGTTTTSASNQPEETTTTTSSSSWVERLGDAIDKAAERIVEGAPSILSGSTTTTTTTTTTTSTTEKPTASQ